MKFIILTLIELYQKYISVLLGPRCRFYPTCSQYAKEAIEKKGFFKGTYMALRRILKCHPFSPGGYDPIITGEKK
jgi:uncharacterized protein